MKTSASTSAEPKTNASALKKLRGGLKDAGLLGQRKNAKIEKKKPAPSTINPFDLKLNKTKYNIVNKKEKGTQGAPLLSRTKGVEQVGILDGHF